MRDGLYSPTAGAARRPHLFRPRRCSPTMMGPGRSGRRCTMPHFGPWQIPNLRLLYRNTWKTFCWPEPSSNYDPMTFVHPLPLAHWHLFSCSINLEAHDPHSQKSHPKRPPLIRSSYNPPPETTSKMASSPSTTTSTATTSKSTYTNASSYTTAHRAFSVYRFIKYALRGQITNQWTDEGPSATRSRRRACRDRARW